MAEEIFDVVNERDEVIGQALVRKPEPIEWDDVLNDIAKPAGEAAGGVVT